MLVFVDESGDQGLKQRFGSSQLFVMTAVIFIDSDDAYDCSARIKELRRELLGQDRAEFKFNKSSRPIRLRFLEEVSRFDFFYVAISIDKCELLNSEIQMQEPFYRFACKLLFDVTKQYINNASVTIDGNGPRLWRRELQNYLRSKLNAETRIIRDVKMEASNSNDLLQLADMVCGAIYRSYRPDKSDRYLYRKVLYRRELEVVRWPKK